MRGNKPTFQREFGEMRIGIAGPVSIGPIRHLLPDVEDVPATYSFPLIGILARELHGRGHEVVVFAGSDRITVPARFVGERITVLVTPRRKSRNAYDFYRVERKYLREAMGAERCDLIHAHWTYEFAAAAQESGTPTLVTAHDAPLAIQRYFMRTRGAFHWLCRLGLALRVLHEATDITAVSPYVAEHLTKVLRVKLPIQVIPNGVASSLFALGEKRLAAGTQESEPLLATVVEGFTELKNAKRALQAFALLRHKIPFARMNMYGSDFGPDEDASRWANENRLAAGVSFIGKVPQKRLFEELTERATLLFHPTLIEAHPMTICEAMALGVPVVGGRASGGVPFTLDSGRAGTLVDVSDPADMAKTLAALAADPPRRQRLAEYAWKFAKERFTLDVMVESYLERYRTIVKR